MNNILFINDVVLSNENIVKKRKYSALNICLILCGIIVIAINNFTSLKHNVDAASALIFGGGILVLIGIFSFVFGKSKIYYKPTNEELVQKQYMFERADCDVVVKAIEANNFEEIIKRASSNNYAPIKLIVFSTKSKSITCAQVQEYVPYEYRPLNSTVCLIK